MEDARRTSFLIALLLCVVLPGSVAGIASAQQGSEIATAQPTTVTVDLGEWTYELNGNEPLSACVQETRVDYEGTYATLLVFVRHLDGTVAPLGTFTSRATAALEQAAVGDCLTLEGE